MSKRRTDGAERTTAEAPSTPGREGSGIDDGAVYVNIPLAAHMLGREPGEIARLVETGQIESVTAGETCLVPVSGIRHFLMRHRTLHEF